MFFSDWLNLLNLVACRHFPASNITSFLTAEKTPLCISIPFSLSFSAAVHLRCFRNLAIMSSAAVTLMYQCLCDVLPWSPSSIHQGVVLRGQTVDVPGFVLPSLVAGLVLHSHQQGIRVPIIHTLASTTSIVCYLMAALQAGAVFNLL